MTKTQIDFVILFHLHEGGTTGKTVVKSSEQNCYLVSSVLSCYADETFIFQCDEQGKVTNWGEVWGIRPAQHQEVLSQLLSGEITENDFYLEQEEQND